jgi:predicted N-formylglutamate amidohydrolase
MQSSASRRPDTVICAIHSFTPVPARPRAPAVGGCSPALSQGRPPRASDLIKRAPCNAGYVTGDNEPYDGHLDGDSIDRHALQPGRPNILIEVRNDLIADEIWANLVGQPPSPHSSRCTGRHRPLR